MKKYEFVENIPIETTLKHPKIRRAQEVWPDMIKHAKKTIDICQFYISSPKGEDLYPIFGMIIDAARKGIRVRMINDAMYHNNYPTNVNFFENIGNMEVRFLDVAKMMGGGVMHAKYIIIDGTDCFVGSHNFDWKSLKHSQNLGIRIINKQFADILTKLFEYDWELCKTNIRPQSFADEPKYLKKPILIDETDKVSVLPVVSPAALTPKGFHTELEIVMDLIENAKEEILIHIMEYSPN
ncbi:MAG TPA: phospholipase D-like domain-containing protein, partial [bacterium]|nr:phospholipase D-like domain-containing protein [bacterium]